MTTIYVVTSGRYSDYQLEAVFSTREKTDKGESMTQDQFDYLHEGDVIQHVGTGNSYVILTRRLRDGKYSYDAARLIEVTNPNEWEVIRK